MKKTRGYLQSEFHTQYNWLLKNKRDLLDKHFPTVRERHTLESCKASALPHNSRSEWKANSQNSYQAARTNGWIEECCAHMKAKHTLENCKVSATHYNSRKEWQTNSNSSYQAAHKNGWLEECCRHMGKNKNKREVVNLTTREIFESTSSASRSLGKNPTFIAKVIKYNREVDGCFWAYVENT